MMAIKTKITNKQTKGAHFGCTFWVLSLHLLFNIVLFFQWVRALSIMDKFKQAKKPKLLGFMATLQKVVANIILIDIQC
jgi:hypothetical protein